MDVAAALFGERGYAATSIRDIARVLDISIATIYYYFKNKEELLFAIIKSSGNDLLLLLHESMEQFSDPVERLRHMVAGQVCMAYEKKYWVKVYVEEQVNLSKKYKDVIYKQHREIYDTYVKQFQELKKLKRVRVEQLPIAAFAVFGMVNWCYRWFKEDRRVPLEEVARIIVDIFFHGILHPGDALSSGVKQSRQPAKK
jgi:AcrR family transcriptional regulator